MEVEDTLAPLVAWEISLNIQSDGAGVTIHYLADPLDSLEKAKSTPSFLLAAPQLVELSNALLRAATRLDALTKP